METISRKGSFDAGHRVMNEKFKCFNVHGHTYLYTLTFSFTDKADIGYAIDFKEIKRVFCQWIDDYLDHGAILNPADTDYIELCKKLGSKYWLMSLNGTEYCNPTVENIAKEIFLAVDVMLKMRKAESMYGLKLHQVKIYETPNCYCKCNGRHLNLVERAHFVNKNEKILGDYLTEKGILEYDDRKVNASTT